MLVSVTLDHDWVIVSRIIILYKSKGHPSRKIIILYCFLKNYVYWGLYSFIFINYLKLYYFLHYWTKNNHFIRYPTVIGVNVVQFNSEFFILFYIPGVKSVPRNKNTQRSFLDTWRAIVFLVQSDWFLLQTFFQGFNKNICLEWTKKNYWRVTNIVIDCIDG